MFALSLPKITTDLNFFKTVVHFLRIRLRLHIVTPTQTSAEITLILSRV